MLAYELFYGNKVGLAKSSLISNPFIRNKIKTDNEDRWSEAFAFLIEKYSGRKMEQQVDLYTFLGNAYQRAYERETLLSQNKMFSEAVPITESDEDGNEFVSKAVYSALDEFYSEDGSKPHLDDNSARERLKRGLKRIMSPISDDDVTELSNRLIAYAFGSDPKEKSSKSDSPYINIGTSKDRQANRLRARMYSAVSSSKRSQQLRDLISKALN